MDKEICYTDTLEFYSARTKNEIMSFVVKWIELQVFILSKVSQTQKEKKKTNFPFPPAGETHKSGRKAEEGLCEERGEPKARKGSKENRGRKTHDFMFYLICSI